METNIRARAVDRFVDYDKTNIISHFRLALNGTLTKDVLFDWAEGCIEKEINILRAQLKQREDNEVSDPHEILGIGAN